MCVVASDTKRRMMERESESVTRRVLEEEVEEERDLYRKRERERVFQRERSDSRRK